MDCPDPSEMLASLDGAAGPWRRFAVQKHTRGCAKCQSRLAALAGIEHVLFQHFELGRVRRGLDCPDPDDLLAFSDAGLVGGTRERVVAHLAQCEACSDWVRDSKRWIENPEGAFPRTPRQLLRSAREMAGPKPRNRWTLVAYPAAAAALIALGLLVVLPQKFLHVPQPSSQSELKPHSAPLAGSGPALNGVVGVRPGPSDSVAFRYRLGGSGEIREVIGPPLLIPNLSSGDDYGLRVRPLRPGWLYVFQADSGGRLVQLFPNARYGIAQNPVQADTDQLIPSDRLWFYLDRSEGVEKIFVAFSSVRREKWQQLFKDSAGRSDSPAGEQLVSEISALSTAAGVAEPRDYCIVFRFTHERERSQ